jgi:hypothetical protein
MKKQESSKKRKDWCYIVLILTASLNNKRERESRTKEREGRR